MLIIIGCNKNTIQTDDMNSMVVPDGFTFETTKEVDISITMPTTVDFSELKSRFDVYTDDPEKGGKYLLSGSFDENGKYSGMIRVPSSLRSILVITMAGGIEIDLPEDTNLKEGGVIIDFGDDYGNYPPDSLDPETKGTIQSLSQNYVKGYTSQNMISNGDFSTDDFGYIFYWSNTIPMNQRWYISQYTGQCERYNDNGDYIIRTPVSEPGNYYYGGVTQLIDAQEGDLITMSADIKSFSPGNGLLYAWLYIIPLDGSGDELEYFNVVYPYPEDEWVNKTIAATMPAGTEEVKILLWFNDYAANSFVAADNVIVTGPVSDSDGDGVDDELDDYPNDETRAFNVYYPNSEDWGTFAFEDLWPGKGDYDFNDLILDYQFKSVINSSNELVEFFTDYSVRAVGASLINGFGIMLDGDPDNVSSVSGTTFTESYIELNANGTEQSQTNTVVFFFDNSFSMIGSSGSAFINTKTDVPYVEPDTNQLHLLFNNAVANTGTAPYNPFIVTDKVRGQEVHLAGQSPTDLADTDLFGTWADDSDPTTGKYYQTSNNLPWALDIPVNFQYPVEQVQIIDAYNFFEDWAESGGSLYDDWYTNTVGYRNSKNIYSPPE